MQTIIGRASIGLKQLYTVLAKSFPKQQKLKLCPQGPFFHTSEKQKPYFSISGQQSSKKNLEDQATWRLHRELLGQQKPDQLKKAIELNSAKRPRDIDISLNLKDINQLRQDFTKKCLRLILGNNPLKAEANANRMLKIIESNIEDDLLTEAYNSKSEENIWKYVRKIVDECQRGDY